MPWARTAALRKTARQSGHFFRCRTERISMRNEAEQVARVGRFLAKTIKPIIFCTEAGC